MQYYAFGYTNTIGKFRPCHVTQPPATAADVNAAHFSSLCAHRPTTDTLTLLNCWLLFKRTASACFTSAV